MNGYNYYDYGEKFAAWHETGCLRIHEKYIAVKCENKTGERKESIIIPSDKWPLNGKYEVFHYRNTVWLPADENPDIAAAIDATEYRIGYCYDNTDRLVSELRRRGIPSKSYVGWLFTSGTQYPVHHCWCVVETNAGRKGVLDLCDDTTVMLGLNAEKFVGADIEKARELMLDFFSFVKGNNVPNTHRCVPLGQPFPSWLYVGSPCEPETGRQIFQNLIKKYPGHECRANCNNNDLSITQQKMLEMGLMNI